MWECSQCKLKLYCLGLHVAGLTLRVGSQEFPQASFIGSKRKKKTKRTSQLFNSPSLKCINVYLAASNLHSNHPVYIIGIGFLTVQIFIIIILNQPQYKDCIQNLSEMKNTAEPQYNVVPRKREFLFDTNGVCYMQIGLVSLRVLYYYNWAG